MGPNYLDLLAVLHRNCQRRSEHQDTLFSIRILLAVATDHEKLRCLLNYMSGSQEDLSKSMHKENDTKVDWRVWTNLSCTPSRKWYKPKFSMDLNRQSSPCSDKNLAIRASEDYIVCTPILNHQVARCGRRMRYPIFLYTMPNPLFVNVNRQFGAVMPWSCYIFGLKMGSKDLLDSLHWILEHPPCKLLRHSRCLSRIRLWEEERRLGQQVVLSDSSALNGVWGTAKTGSCCFWGPPSMLAVVLSGHRDFIKGSQVSVNLRLQIAYIKFSEN